MRVDHIPRSRNASEGGDDYAADRVKVSILKLDVEQVFDLFHMDDRSDASDTLRDLVEEVLLRLMLVANVPHDLFQHIFQRHDACDAAVFVHDDGEV